MTTQRDNPAYQQGWDAYVAYDAAGRPSAMLRHQRNPFDFRASRASFGAYAGGWMAAMRKLNPDYEYASNA